MSSYTITVKGSKEGEYEIDLIDKGDSLEFRCSCSAGQNNQFCKHRLAILEGDQSILVGTSELGEFESMVNLLKNSPYVYEECKNILDLTAKIESLKKDLTRKKKDFGRSLSKGIKKAA